MLAKMGMRIATTWGNELEITLSTELDNAHALTTAEIALLMTMTMQTFCENVRNENERVLEIQAPSDEARRDLDRRLHVRQEASTTASRERERYDELQGARQDPRADQEERGVLDT